MPSFDIVNKPDIQSVEDAVNNASRQIGQRYDFRGVNVVLELNKKERTLKVQAPDDMKIGHMRDILNGALIDRGLSPKVLDWGTPEDASLGAVRYNVKVQEGLDKEVAKDIAKRIKDSKLKVKASIQGDQVRVEGKSIDDLQEIIADLKKADYSVPLDFQNMKR